MGIPSVLLTIVLAGAALAGCTKTNVVSRVPVGETPQALMVRVAKQMQACWFRKKEPAVGKFRLASEVNSFSGKPRVLLVPRNKPSGLPVLVVQAERKNGRNDLSTFGPLLARTDGQRLARAVNKWAAGSQSC